MEDTRVRAGNDMSGQGRARQHTAGQRGTAGQQARQEQGQEHIQRRAGQGSGSDSGNGRGMSAFKAGHDRAG